MPIHRAAWLFRPRAICAPRCTAASLWQLDILHRAAGVHPDGMHAGVYCDSDFKLPCAYLVADGYVIVCHDASSSAAMSWPSCADCMWCQGCPPPHMGCREGGGQVPRPQDPLLAGAGMLTPRQNPHHDQAPHEGL